MRKKTSVDPDTENDKNRCNNNSYGRAANRNGSRDKTTDKDGGERVRGQGKERLTWVSLSAWGAGRISRAAARAFELIGSREVGGATVDGRTSREGVGRGRGEARDDESRWRWPSCDV